MTTFEMTTFEKIFNGLNDGTMIGNPAYNMQAVRATFPAETQEWNRDTAAEFRKFAMKKMEAQVRAGNPVWKKS